MDTYKYYYNVIEYVVRYDRDFLLHTLKSHGVKCQDVTTENIGYTRKVGRPIIFDYGYGIQCNVKDEAK